MAHDYLNRLVNTQNNKYSLSIKLAYVTILIFDHININHH
jgi:hypothetical protein